MRSTQPLTVLAALVLTTACQLPAPEIRVERRSFVVPRRDTHGSVEINDGRYRVLFEGLPEDGLDVRVGELSHHVAPTDEGGPVSVDVDILPMMGDIALDEHGDWAPPLTLEFTWADGARASAPLPRDNLKNTTWLALRRGVTFGPDGDPESARTTVLFEGDGPHGYLSIQKLGPAARVRDVDVVAVTTVAAPRDTGKRCSYEQDSDRPDLAALGVPGHRFDVSLVSEDRTVRGIDPHDGKVLFEQVFEARCPTIVDVGPEATTITVRPDQREVVEWLESTGVIEASAR